MGNPAGTRAARLALLSYAFVFGSLGLCVAAAVAPGNARLMAVEPRKVSQGRTLLLSFSPPTGVKDARVLFLGRDTPCYRVRGVLQGIIGVPLDAPPGPHPLRLLWKDERERERTITEDIEVIKGRFEAETITLPPAARTTQMSRRLEDENRAVEEALKRSGALRLWSGRFLRPLPGRITSPYGSHRFYAGLRYGWHRGVDLAGAAGTPIAAPAGGRVSLARMFEALGGTIVIDHGQGVSTIYLHQKELKVKEGGRVDAGEIIGLVGSAGMVTGPHLHWNLVVHGVRVDPMEWIERAVAG